MLFLRLEAKRRRLLRDKRKHIVAARGRYLVTTMIVPTIAVDRVVMEMAIRGHLSARSCRMQMGGHLSAPNCPGVAVARECRSTLYQSLG